MRISVVDAWHDLQHITGDWGYHPYNSYANDRVKEYLITRIHDILRNNKIGVEARNGEWEEDDIKVQIVDDIASNITFAAESKGVTVYYEGTNLMVIVKGTRSSPVLIADDKEREEEKERLGAVLVNAHYDSVSTGYGATDDGTAVVTLLQLISYFTNPNTLAEKRPRRDIIFLFNNGEEDYLNGARAFAVSPWGKMPKIFYNLEGAGAGGRATLFRSTDTEVTEFYRKNVRRPFGSSVSADGFKKGLVKSQTDYKVFTEDMGLRGLDVAFWRPRSRYHTEDDDVKHTSRESVWHMLSGAIEVVEGMARDTKRSFEEPFEVGGTDSVWFDMFGRAFVLLRLHILFAISVTIATITPLVLLFTVYLLHSKNKLYMFSNSTLHGKCVHGWKGFFAYPIAFTLATCAVIGTAYLFVKVNPMIIYGSLYVVWACFLSEWFLVAWVVCKIGQWWRGSALTRGYTFGWMWLGWWGLLIYMCYLEDKKGISSGYFVLFNYAGVFIAFWISLLEQFALPPKDADNHAAANCQPLSPSHENPNNYIDGGRVFSYNPNSNLLDPDEPRSPPTEHSPLLSSSRRGSANSSVGTRGRRPWRPSFRRYVDADDGASSHLTEPDSDASEGDQAILRKGVYKYEQRWSRELPIGWGTWVVQWLVSVPVQIILVGQIGLFLGEALGMTGADGSDILTVYLGIATFSILYLLPLAPYLHRITHHLAYACIVLFPVTLFYNLSAFPFTDEARLKIYFQQDYSLSNGTNIVSLVGVEEYIKMIIENELPSAKGKEVICKKDWLRLGLSRCSWEGLPPNVARGEREEWVEVTTVRAVAKRQAIFEIKGRETRACKMLFDKPVVGLKVDGVKANPGNSTVEKTNRLHRHPHEDHTPYSTPHHYPGHYRGQLPPTASPRKPPYEDRSPIYPGGTTELRLWSRDWDRGWRVEVSWEEANTTSTSMEEDKLGGKVVCLWADVNEKGTVPAWDEVFAFVPKWAVGSKLSDGLVEGWVGFEV